MSKDKISIVCKNISQRYDTTNILTDFNYKFRKTGLYVLFGESGSGKTTFLNILAGLEQYNEGSVAYGEKVYVNKVKNEEVLNDIAYIAQDSFFVNYLTLYENLRLCVNEREKIMNMLARFGLEDKVDKYPQFLSGGERQRMALVQALLQDKKILLMDEPTSSLDKANRFKIFQILNQLKTEHLIICSSHDKAMLEHADEVIYFNTLEKYSNNDTDIEQSEELVEYNTSVNKPNKSLYHFVKQQRHYKYRQKLVNGLVITVFTIILMILAYCSDYEYKMEQSLENTYGIRSIAADVSVDIAKDYAFYKENNISEAVFSYRKNTPQGDQDPDAVVWDCDFELTLEVLPFNKDRFPYSEHMLYGTYFTNENQIILGYSDAELMSYDLESLIGKTKTLVLPDKTYEFEIVGIFDKYSEKMYTHLRAIDHGAQMDSGIYLNSDFTKRYFDNEEILGNCQENKVGLNLYFDNPKDMKRFKQKFEVSSDADDNADVYWYKSSENFVEYEFAVTSAGEYLYPVTNIMIAISVIMYFILKKLEVNYTQSNLCVYQYYGYSRRKVKWTSIFYYMTDVLYKFFIAVVLCLSLSFIFNQLNEKFLWIQFEAFVFDTERAIKMLIALMVSSAVLSLGLFRNLKIQGWYQMLKKRRDLL